MSDTLVPMRNNDDQILNCALYFLKKIASEEDGLILTTNDEGLRLKALLSKVETKNVNQLLSCLPVKSAPGATGVTIVLNNTGKVNTTAINLTDAPSGRHTLPGGNDVWKLILTYIRPKELPKMSSISFAFYQMINGDEDVWKKSIEYAFEDKTGILIPKNSSPKQWYIRWRRQTLTISSTNTCWWRHSDVIVIKGKSKSVRDVLCDLYNLCKNSWKWSFYIRVCFEIWIWTLHDKIFHRIFWYIFSISASCDHPPFLG